MKKMWKKTLSLLMTLSMVITMMPAVAWAENICAHVHNAECGYEAAQACQHVCSLGNGCVTALECTHVHDDNCYAGCTEEHTHGEGCNVTACTHTVCDCPKEETECRHDKVNHDDTCGYSAGVECEHFKNDLHDESCAVTGILDMANGSVVIDADGYTITGNNKVDFTGDYTITQSVDETANTITVNGIADGKTITLKGVNIESENVPIKANATVTIQLLGENKIKYTAAQNSALHIVKDKTVTLCVPDGMQDSDGSLTAEVNKRYTSAIGAGDKGVAGYLVVNSGTITAKRTGSTSGEGTSIGAIRPNGIHIMQGITINGGIVNATSVNGKAMGLDSKTDNIAPITITGGYVYSNNGFSSNLTVSGGNIKTDEGKEPTIADKAMTKLYVVGANGIARENEKVTINTWDTYTDDNGIITTYLGEDESIICGTEACTKLPDGWLIGGECVCNTATLTFEDTADEVDVYSADVDMDVVVRGECAMPIHKDVEVVCVIESVTLEDGTSVNKDDYASYAGGTLTLKPAGNTDNYIVTLSAKRDGVSETPVTHEVTVWASNIVGRKLDISNGPITVTAGTGENEGKVVYTQENESIVFVAKPDTPVTITGTYEKSYSNNESPKLIMITDCSPTIVLKNIYMKVTGRYLGESFVIEGTRDGEGQIVHKVTLLIDGENTIIRDINGNDQHAGIDIRDAEVTINCVTHQNSECTDKECNDKLIVTMTGSGNRSAAIGTRQTENPEGFTLNIDGGKIEATTNNYGAAIGTNWVSGNTLTNEFIININDGYVKAVAPDTGVAIGSGRSNVGPNEDIMNVNISGGVVEAVSISVKDRNNSTSEAINASNVNISGNADVTVKGLLQAKSVEIADNAELDMQKKEGWEEDHGRNPGGSISNGYQWKNKESGEVVTRLGTVDVKVSGDAKLTTEGGINGTLTTSDNAVAEINGIVLVDKGSGVDTSLGGVTDNVTVGAGSSVSVAKTIAGDVIVEGGGTFNGAVIPDSVESVTIPADGDLSVDEEGDITLPAGADLDTDEAGNIILPKGSVVEKSDGTEITLGGGGSLGTDGAVTMYEGETTIKKENDDTTTVVIPEGMEGTVNGSTVTLPTGSTVTLPNGTSTTVSNGGSVNLEDGTVTHNYSGSSNRPNRRPSSTKTEEKVETGKEDDAMSGNVETKEIVLTIGSNTVLVDGESVTNDVAPIIQGDRTFLPIRVIAEALGATVTWSQADQSVTIVKGDTTIVLYIGQAFALVNGNPVQLDVPAFISNDRTYLPIRFISENLGANVAWDGLTRTVTIIG